MKRLLRLCASLLGVVFLASCQIHETAEDWPSPAPALWQAESPQGQVGWLFGTVHSLPEGLEWKSPPVEDAFARAGLLVVEIADLGNDALSRSVFERLAYMTGLPPLSQRVPPQAQGLVANLIERAGARESDFAQMETWAAALALSAANRLGSPANGVDRQLLGRGKPVAGLESYETQLNLFDALPSAEQADLLVAVAREAAEGDPREALEHWLTGDMAALERHADAGLLADPELRAILLDGRNLAWVDRIVTHIAAGRRPFVAVGSAHMLGESGLPALLAARGFRVQRIQ